MSIVFSPKNSVHSSPHHGHDIKQLQLHIITEITKCGSGSFQFTTDLGQEGNFLCIL
jgi:hypothetical protein